MLTRHEPSTILALAALTLVLTMAGCQASSGSGPRTRPGPGPGSPSPLDAHDAVITDWNQAAFEAYVAENKYAHPFIALRAQTMVHLAQHDALAAIRPAYAPSALTERAPDAHPVAAAASAAFEVLTAELPGQREALQRRLAASLAAIPDGAGKEKGLALGRRAAAATLARRKGDGSDVPAVVKLPEEEPRPGVYQPIPPADFVYAPEWRYLRPFALQNPQQFRLPAPPALTSAAYAAGFAEVKAVGGKESAVRTPEQTGYAKFWWEFSEIGWNRIARNVATERKLGLQASARLFALLNIALSDAYLAGWDSKLHHNFWRPTTAIRAAEIDGNPATQPDARWESAEATPPIHDYPSTHSALGDASAEVLAHVFGDSTAFSFTSTTAGDPKAPRGFASFSQAADENADSRVVGGLHFRFSCEAGQALGRQVGAWVVATALRPTPAMASAR
jgi:hypothetical protein